MPNYAEKLAEAHKWADKAKEAEKRKDWTDALACLEKAIELSLGSDFRDDCWKEMQRLRMLANSSPRKVKSWGGNL